MILEITLTPIQLPDLTPLFYGVISLHFSLLTSLWGPQCHRLVLWSLHLTVFQTIYYFWFLLTENTSTRSLCLTSLKAWFTLNIIYISLSTSPETTSLFWSFISMLNLTSILIIQHLSLSFKMLQKESRCIVLPITKVSSVPKLVPGVHWMSNRYVHSE